MKFFANVLSIIVLFAINSVSARQMGGAAPAPKPAVQPQPIPVVNRPLPQQQPAAQKQTYKDLVAYVKNAGNVWDTTKGMLRPDFVTTMIQKARAARLEDFQLEALLKTARDMHGIFSGNQNKDIATLQAVDNQIAVAIR